jgi:hypothetical protein
MTTLYNGGPVMGGTFPALIWASVISAWEEIKANHAADRAAAKAGREAAEGGASETYVPPVETEAAPESEETEAAPEAEAAPETEAAPEATPEAAPEAAPESSGGGGGVTAG